MCLQKHPNRSGIQNIDWPPPTHLFISYAVEDATLARKLAARGHPVWFDQMKLLSGEPWPQIIGDGIKHRTFQMLALIFEHSLRKQKPTGERTLAQRIAEQRKIPDFLIPLKVDGSELDWLTTTVSYISFTRGWADGWRALLKKLDSIPDRVLLANAAPLAASRLLAALWRSAAVSSRPAAARRVTQGMRPGQTLRLMLRTQPRSAS